MTYVIIWDYLDNKNFAHVGNELCFEDRDEANKAWIAMKKNGTYLNMRHETRNEKQRTEKEYWTVQVRFYKHGKLYTYLTKTEIKVGEEVVVRTSEGREILKVEQSGKQTRSQLEKQLAFDKYVYISGKVVPA